MMKKTLFEKLTQAGKPISLEQSVAASIERILNASGFLDGDEDAISDPGKAILDSIYSYGMPYIVDQSSSDDEQTQHYRYLIRKVLLRFEPRLKQVTVSNLRNVGTRSSCHLKIELKDGEFEQDFVFTQ